WRRTVITHPPGYNPGPARLFASQRRRRCPTCRMCSPPTAAPAKTHGGGRLLSPASRPTTVGSMPGGVLTQTHHMRVAVGRQDSDGRPTTGTIYLGGGGAKPEVRIRCEPVTPEGQ
ncbi:hypothetical protein, partial [Corallococcus exercitus]|uniref:hypothetical protein n=1 Tax=Corallococcus exercitus TaxID=2316736 RepID=UPI001ABFA5BF